MNQILIDRTNERSRELTTAGIQGQKAWAMASGNLTAAVTALEQANFKVVIAPCEIGIGAKSGVVLRMSSQTVGLSGFVDLQELGKKLTVATHLGNPLYPRNPNFDGFVEDALKKSNATWKWAHRLS